MSQQTAVVQNLDLRLSRRRDSRHSHMEVSLAGGERHLLSGMIAVVIAIMHDHIQEGG